MENTEKDIAVPMDISALDPAKCFFNPGCGLLMYKPQAVEKLHALLCAGFGKVGLFTDCCKKDPGLPAGSVVICDCAGCTKRFGTLYEGVSSVTLFEILAHCGDLPLPDHGGIKMSVQDPCYFRNRPHVHQAVRTLLERMNIQVVDSEFSGQRSVCCGELLVDKLPIEKVLEKQKERCAQFPCEDVAVYCAACQESIASGGKRGHYLMDLLIGEETHTTGLRLDEYRKHFREYVDRTQFSAT